MYALLCTPTHTRTHTHTHTHKHTRAHTRSWICRTPAKTNNASTGGESGEEDGWLTQGGGCGSLYVLSKYAMAYHGARPGLLLLLLLCLIVP